MRFGLTVQTEKLRRTSQRLLFCSVVLPSRLDLPTERESQNVSERTG